MDFVSWSLWVDEAFQKGVGRGRGDSALILVRGGDAEVREIDMYPYLPPRYIYRYVKKIVPILYAIGTLFNLSFRRLMGWFH